MNALLTHSLLGLALTLVIAGCGGGGDHQNLPIGSRCAVSSDCGTGPYLCLISDQYWGGYCTKACATHGDCPLDAMCSPEAKQCRRSCATDDDCRFDDHYRCLALGGDVNVCETDPAPAAAGASAQP